MANYGLYTDFGTRAIVGSFYRRYERDANSAWSRKVSFVNDKTDQPSEVYKSLGAAPYPRKWIGNRQSVDASKYSITVDNVEYEATFEPTIADVRRDKTGQIRSQASEMALGYIDHWDQLITDLQSANSLAYDNVAFFATTHSIGDSGTINNLVTASEVPELNVANPTGPTQSEFAKALLGSIQWLLGFKNERGNPANGQAKKFLVEVPMNLWGAAKGAVMAERLDGGDSNVLGSQEFQIEVAGNARRANSAIFHVYRMDGANKPYIQQDEEGIRVDVLGEGSEHAIKTGKMMFATSATRGVGYGEFLHALRATLS